VPTDDGTRVRANASYKSFLPIEVALDPDEYKRRLRRDDRRDPDGPLAPEPAELCRDARTGSDKHPVLAVVGRRRPSANS
jgi:hypothetical protein